MMHEIETKHPLCYRTGGSPGTYGVWSNSNAI
mgnify:CR=1 FL=1